MALFTENGNEVPESQLNEDGIEIIPGAHRESDEMKPESAPAEDDSEGTPEDAPKKEPEPFDADTEMNRAAA